jgi:hypothetical protein
MIAVNGPLERGDRPYFTPDPRFDAELIDWSAAEEFPSEASPEFRFLKNGAAPAHSEEPDWDSIVPAESVGPRTADPSSAAAEVPLAMPPAPAAARETTGRSAWRHAFAAATILLIGAAGFVASSGVMSRLISNHATPPPVATPQVTTPQSTTPQATTPRDAETKSSPVATTEKLKIPPRLDVERRPAVPAAATSSSSRSATRTGPAQPPPTSTAVRPRDKGGVAAPQAAQSASPGPPPVGKANSFAVNQPALVAPEVPAAPRPTPSQPSATVAPPAAPPAAPSAPPKTPTPDTTTPTPPKAETVVAQVLEEFRQAYGRLDAETVGALWPSVNTKTLGRAFDQLDNQELTFDNCTISTAGARAQASCAGKATYVPRVGNKTTHVEPRKWTFRLKKVGDNWVIEAVDAR